MPKKKQARRSSKPAAIAPQTPAKLSKREEDLLWHMAHGYQLETTGLGENPMLRQMKGNTTVRADATRRTIEALQQRRLIEVAKAGTIIEPTIWRLTRKGRES